jgi:hypothetical protein
MAGKFAHSWQLAKASADVLNKERALLVFPLLSALSCLLVVASFAMPVFESMRANGAILHGQSQSQSGFSYLGLFLFYLIQYSVIFFFNTALVGSALAYMNGERPTVGDGLRIAVSKLPQILGYALIAASVGMLLRMLQERFGFIGRLIVGLIGLAWTVATFLVVPILAATDQGPIDAVKHSAGMLKQTWGENIIGNAGINLVFGLVMAVVVVLMVLGTMLGGSMHSPVFVVVSIVIGALVMTGLGLVQSALQGVYAAALYRYVKYGDTDNGFEQNALEQAFRPKT